MKNLFFALFVVLSLFAGCGKEDGGSGSEPNTPQNPTPTESKIQIADSDKTINFTKDAGERSISFTASESWTATLINDRADGWCSVSPTSGQAGSASIKISVTNNDTPDERSASVQLKSGTATVTIVVTQKQQDALTVTQSRFDVGAEGSDITIVVAANISVEYSIASAASSWIHSAQGANTRAMTTSQFKFTIDPNATSEKREGAITVYGNGLSETIMVYQAKGDGSSGNEGDGDNDNKGGDTDPDDPDNPGGGDDPNNPGGGEEPEQPETPSIVVSTNQVTLTSAEQSFAVEVSHNVDVSYEISVEGQSWLSHVDTRAMSTNTYYFNVTENDDVTERSATIRFINAETGTSETVTVTQQGVSASLVVSETKVELTAAQQSFEVVVAHNVDVAYEISKEGESWLSRIETRAMTSDTYTFVAAENEETAERSATITFTNPANGLSETVEITQAGTAPAIVVSPHKVELSAEEQTFMVEVAHNVDFTVSIPENATWLTQVETRAMQTDLVTFRVTANTETEHRTAEITFTNNQSGLSEKIAVTQEWVYSTLTNNKIYYTSLYGRIVKPTTDYFGDAKIIQNTYENGQGTILFDKELTMISEHAFEFDKEITEIQIPNSVTSIGAYAFRMCSALMRVNIPDGVELIDEYTFYYCTYLTSIKIPDSVTTIGFAAFMNSSLTSITLPNATTIGDFAFSGCKLSRIQLSDKLTHIGACAFAENHSLKELTIPDSVIEIGGRAFHNCEKLADIAIGKNVAKIGLNAFGGLSDSYPVGDVIVTFGKNDIRITEDIAQGFYSCHGLTINNGIIEENAFSSSQNQIRDIILGDGVPAIGENAFRNCSKLLYLTIPASITSIGASAFEGVTAIREVRLKDLAAWCRIDFGNEYANPSASNISKQPAAIYLNGNLVTDLTIPEEIDIIKPYAFYNWQYLENVSIPYGVTGIQTKAFSKCSNLKEIRIPTTVSFLETAAISGSQDITVIFGSDDFLITQDISHGIAADRLTIKNGRIGDKAFYDYSPAIYLTLGDGVKSVGVEAFYHCRYIDYLTIIGNGETEIKERAFADIDIGLDKLTIGSGVGSIEEYAFYGCNHLSKVHTTDLAAWCRIDFRGLYSNPIHKDLSTLYIDDEEVTELVIPEEVTVLRDNTFCSIANLKRVFIHENVTEIGNTFTYGKDGYSVVFTLYCKAKTPPHTKNSGSNMYPFGLIYVPRESVSAYQAAWASVASRIKGYDF